MQSYPFLRIKRGVENFAVSQLLLLLPELAQEEVRCVLSHLFCSYGTESDRCNLKNHGVLEAKAKQHYQEIILMKPHVPCSWSVLQFPLVYQVPPSVKLTWSTLAKRHFLLNSDNKPGRYTKTYSLLC